MMRKIFLTLSIVLCHFAFSQSQQINYGDFPKPVPSTSYLSTYQEMPASTATGVPDISIPLGGISSRDSSINENFVLSYNPYNVNNEDFVSEVGLGWSLFSGGSISKQIVGGLDELFDNSSAPNYNFNEFDDLYYYNLPNGISGKFKINRSGNVFTVVNYDRNNVKIEFTGTANTATLIVNSFTIIDDQGYKFLFNDFSQSLYSSGNKLYRSAFYLTSIKNLKNIDLISYQYQKNNQYIGSTNNILYQNCKLIKVNSKGLGSIDIEYTYNSALNHTLNDPYSISKIKAQNNYGRNLYEFNFEYSIRYFQTLANGKRVLEKITKKNFENSSSPEITKFEYHTSPLPDAVSISYFETAVCSNIEYSQTMSYPSNSIIGVLKKMNLPTGGAIEYEFEPNEYFFDKNTPNYIQDLKNYYIDNTIQKIEQIAYMDYNNSNIGSLRMWNLQGDPNNPKNFILYLVHLGI